MPPTIATAAIASPITRPMLTVPTTCSPQV